MKAQQNWYDYAVPATFVTLGFIGVYNTALCDFKEDINRSLCDLRGDNYLHFDDYVQLLPATYFVLGDYVGTPSKHNINERILLTATATIIFTTIVNGVKYTVREPRPDTHARNSFPSGHTATAFMGATLVWHSYGPIVGLGAYTVAAGIGFMRMYNERHWLNDVIGGAGVGMIAANLSYLLLPWEKSWFKHKDSQKVDVSLFPYCGPYNAVGIDLSIRF
ncbi:MAG: phosphatase PAP2 family protein [Bacteroidales bacterium]|nr:phosphatase PAP2 family protein [Bacteroidales bacterium]